MARDAGACVRMAKDIARRNKQGKPSDQLASKLARRIESSQQEFERRDALVPTAEPAPDLPVSEHWPELLQAFTNNQVIVVAGETGSGKTTQLPKLCLQAGQGRRGRIGHTQPRRIAARTVCKRIAEELGAQGSSLVSYQVRFKDNSTDDTLVKLMTDGILLAEIQHDPYLNQYDTLIIDEAHERSLNIDFLLGYIKRILPRRPDLKVLITSATIDVESLSRHFSDAPVVEVSGRTYPVETQYLPPDEMPTDLGSSNAGQIVCAMEHILALEQGGSGFRGGDVLVFLPGERDIREAALALRRLDQQLDVLPLYARLGSAEQDRVFNPKGGRGRRVVLATNVAETSLTVPGIRYVIDTGVARISRYSHRSRVQRLPIEAISQASAEQRKGRCGRTAPGLCLRLYSEQDLMGRPEFTDPEIMRTNLASVILQMTGMNLGDLDAFPFVTVPDQRLVNDGYRLLDELGALDGRQALSKTGKTLSRIPVDPRIARMLIEASTRGCLEETLIIAAGLSIQDPRERPHDKQQAADEKHARFKAEHSDFMGLLNLWRYFEEQRQALSKTQLRKLCQREFLSHRRLFEWRDLHHQLRLVSRELGWKENQEPADEAVIHRSLLAGLASHVGQREERREYNGTRNRKFQIFPGSVLGKKPPPWLMATELVDTGKLYARVNARIEPEWVEEAAPHLLKRSYSEPHWNQRRGAVMALEKTTLYGLVIRDKKRVNYSKIDPVICREVFIRSALVEEAYKSKADFWVHNSKLREGIRELEEKIRRHDLMVDDDDIYQFYDRQIPANIVNAAGFERWLKKQAQGTLALSEADLLRRDASTANEQAYPEALQIDELALPLRYQFSPGKQADGVNVDVPVALINRLPLHRFDWLVPGMLYDKCVELIKSLPKSVRKQFVPVPDFASKALALMEPCDKPLMDELGRALKQLSGYTIPADAWNPAALDPWYHMYVRIIGADGEVLGEGRDIHTLVDKHRPQLRQEIDRATDTNDEASYTRWEFGELPQYRLVKHGDLSVRVYPAVVDKQQSVMLSFFDSAEEAAYQLEPGLARLAMLYQAQQRKYLHKEFIKLVKPRLEMASLVPKEELVEDFLTGVFAEVFVRPFGRPASAQDFERNLASAKGELVTKANEYLAIVDKIIGVNHRIHALLNKLDGRIWSYAIEDMGIQLSGLLQPHFLKHQPLSVLREFPRYLDAIAYRADKLQGHEQKDRRATREIEPHQQRLADYLKENPWPSEAALAYRWGLEEFRVSLFAQAIGTRMPVSKKRLDKLWQGVSEP